ncbi:hypothetical protein, partial [Pontibacter sp. H249]|uniref:hypothetical protein n=1 Tax=Pontibacter sp. H249 TaxID=3133420 RepID=UPI0030BF3C71
MDELSRLVKVVSKHASKTSPLFNLEDEASLETKLFHLINSEEVSTDGYASQILYGSSELPASYRMLKSRFKKKLLNHIRFLELPEGKYSVSELFRRECATAILDAETLTSVGEIKLADKILDKVFKKSVENEIYDYVVRILELKKSCSHILHNKTKFENYTKLLKHYYKVENAEREAEHIYQEVMLSVYQKVELRYKLMPLYAEALERLETLWNETGSSKVFNYAHILSISEQELLGNYQNIFLKIKGAEELLKEGKIHKNWFNYRFNNFIIVYA